MVFSDILSLGGKFMGELLVVLFILSASVPVSGIVLGSNPKSRNSVFEKTNEEREEEERVKELLIERIRGEK